MQNRAGMHIPQPGKVTMLSHVLGKTRPATWLPDSVSVIPVHKIVLFLKFCIAYFTMK